MSVFRHGIQDLDKRTAVTKFYQGVAFFLRIRNTEITYLFKVINIRDSIFDKPFKVLSC